MPSTFETLSDEVLMTIFRYSGDAYTIFRIFHGLNQRLNCILIDRCLHLFTDFLCIDTHDPASADYYKSDVFQNLSYQLSCTHSTINEQELRQCFQSLVAFHIKEQFTRLETQVQSRLITFQAMRQQLSDVDIVDIDNQLRNAFFDLRDNIITIKSIKQIESLVLTRAGCLKCANHEMNQFNLAQALNQLLLRHLNNIHSVKRPLIQSITYMLKTLIISNIDLLMNRDNTEVEESATVWYFLFYSIYQLQYWYYTPPDICINMKCYQAVIHLLLFAIQCQKQVTNNENWARQSLFDVLSMISANQNELFVQSVQWEILKILVHENVLTEMTPWDEDQINRFRLIFSNLLERNRLDVILLLYHQLENVRSYFDNPNLIHQNVNMLTGSSTGRQLFKIFTDEKPLKTWLTSKDLIFSLLKKKERKLIEKILRSSSFLIHQVDEHGNDPLLYICLNVRGCRHRIIQFLITIGCDLQRRNFNGEHFIDTIQLRRNRSLLKDLLDNEIVKIDDIQDVLTTQRGSSIEN
jgi:hypothetical protein